MKNITKVFFLSVLLFCSFSSNASHFAGGEVEYACIGPRTWKIKLTLYRDCSGCLTCYANATIGSRLIADMTARPNTSLGLNPVGCSATPSQVNVPMFLIKVEDTNKNLIDVCGNSGKNGCNNLGTVTPGSYTPSIEKWIFEGTLNLSASSLNNTTCAFWDIFYMSNARNSGMANIPAEDFTIGATINIFNQSQNPCANNSPIFKNESIILACSNQEYIFNLGAVDPDNDSLTYEVGNAWRNAPWTSATYNAPYSANYPFPLYSSKPPHSNFPQPNGPYIIIDSINGDIGFNPANSSSSFIYGSLCVFVKQWTYNSNGTRVLAGITMRDMQIYTKNCPINNPPRFVTIPTLPNGNPKYNYEVNAGDQICFTVTAKDTDAFPAIPRFDTTRISWNEGIVRPANELTFAPAYAVGNGVQRPREDSRQFCWQTKASDYRSLPYTFTVNAVDNNCPYIGTISKSFTIKVNPERKNAKHLLQKDYQKCGTVNYLVYKDTPYVWLNSATLQIANKPNDKNFIYGSRNITPININPSGNQLDTINQPRLMFADSTQYTQAGKYYISFSYNSPHQTTPIQVLDSIEINADSVILSNFITHGDTTVCFGDSSIFSTINLGSRYRYQWQIDNSTIVGANTNFIYAKQQGSYKLIITDTLINCTKSSNPINFTVKPRVNLKISLLNNDYCAFLPNAISYRDSSSLSSGTYTRLWHFGDGSTTNLLSGNKVYDATGDYIVKLVVNTNSGCKDSIISTVTVTKPPKPVITVSSNTEFCQGKSIVLSSNTYPNATYFWYKNNTRISLTNSTNITVNEQANYKVIISSGFNCNDTSNIISTLVYPAPKVGFTVNNLVQCLKGNNFNLSDTSTITSGQLSRVWSWQNNANNQPNIDITINSPGTEQIKLIVTSNNGCKDSAMKNLTVLPSPSIGSIAGPSSNLLTNQQYSYNINQQLNHTYNWHVTNGNVVNGQGTNAISAQWLSQGTGFVKAIISNTDACNDSAVLMVSVGINAPIITSFTPQTGSNGTQITINGNNLNGASAVLFGGVNAKNFNVVSSSVITATVDSGATGNVSVITPNGTALLSGFVYINNTGVSEFVTQSYTIFPNPVSSEIIIESDKTLNNSRFELMDLNGKVLINTTCNTSTNRLNIDVKTLSPAIYLLRITSHGQTSTVKVVKQ